MRGNGEVRVGSQSVAVLTTRNGLVLNVRQATSADSDALVALFRQVSPEDFRFRFQEAVEQINAAWLAPLLEGGRTFLALDDAGEAVACCMLTDGADATTADVNLAVRSDRKGQGVSWTLLHHVLDYAAAAGITRVMSLESGEDRLAINLEREMGFVARLSSAAPIELTLSKLLI
jgi:N-acetylglutamate synthase-like GNAT family acetyltransferase